MLFKNTKRGFSYALALALSLSVLSIVALAATTVTVLDGQVSITDSVGTGNASDNTVTITAKGGLFSKKINNITITNETVNKATLKFDYSASTYNSFTIAGATPNSASGSYSVLLDGGASLVVVIQSNSGMSNLTATLKLSNFSLVAAEAASDITFEYDESLGSIAVGGDTVDSGYKATGITVDTGVAITAAPAPGARFLGWMNTADNSVQPVDDNNKIYPTASMTLKAVFVNASSEGWFLAGNQYLFNDLNRAVEKASGLANKTVVLMNDATLPAGTYTILSGVTLLIPYDDANTLHTTEPALVSYSKPSFYRTLTMASGANITVNGAISVGGQQATNMGNNGSPSKKLGRIHMATGSSITVNNGANLYTWGYITGSGSVLVKSGGTVYEDFQTKDWRGGNATFSMLNNDQQVFPLSQYYIQNIEVPLTLESGAVEKISTTVSVAIAGEQTALATFIGSNDGLFRLSSGTITKDYDENSDRLVFDVEGTVGMSRLLIELTGNKLDSANYVLPLNNNITVNLKSGTVATATQHIALLPGTQLNIDSGATLQMADVTLYSSITGKQSGTETCCMYIYDADQWGAYCGSGNKTFIPINYAPGQKYTRTEADLVDAAVRVNGTFDASSGNLYTTTSGANIYSADTGVVKITAGSAKATYQATQSSNSISAYPEIPIISAKLKNRAGSYVETTTQTYTYCPECERWIEGVEGIVAHVITNGNIVHAATWAGAISEYAKADDVKYIQLVKDCAADVPFVNKTVLDVNGHNVSVVKVNGTLYGMDSTSDGYGAPSGSIAVTSGTVETVTEFAGKNNIEGDSATLHRYLAVQDDTDTTKWEFHRFNISVTDYYLEVLSTGTARIGFGATFRGDSAVIAAVTDMGFTVNTVPAWVSTEGKGMENVSLADQYKLYYTVDNPIKDGDNTALAMLKFNNEYTQNSEEQTVNFLSALKTYYDSTSDTQVKNVIDKFMTAAQLTWPTA